MAACAKYVHPVFGEVSMAACAKYVHLVFGVRSR